jgi:hypothetical protein
MTPRFSVGILRRFGISFRSYPQASQNKNDYCFVKPEDGIENYPETSYHSCDITPRRNPKALEHQLRRGESRKVVCCFHYPLQ